MTRIKFNEPFIAGNEQKYIQDVFDSQSFYGSGKYTKESESLISKHLQSKNVLLTDSCSSALDMVAILLRDHSCSQEVIMPSYTFTSTANAFIKVGFNIKFVEVIEDNLTIDTDHLKECITDRTSAIIAVHYGSHIADLESIRNISSKNNLFLIEDAAQSYYSKYKDQAVGTFGDFGCFSFHQTKNIHSGLGGALTVKSSDHYDNLRMIWERGTDRQNVLKGKADKYTWRIAGGSYYPTELQAAFLYEQLNNIEENISRRKEIYDIYYQELKSIKNRKLIHFPEFFEDYKSNYHSFYLIDTVNEDSDDLRKHLNNCEIDSYIGYIPLHSSPMGILLGNSIDDLPRTNFLSRSILRLPFHNNLSNEDVLKVTKEIKVFYGI